MDNKVFDANAIISVHVTNIKSFPFVTWHPGRKRTFWKDAVEPGFYDAFGEVEFNASGYADYMNTRVFCKDRSVYRAASVTIGFINGEKVTKHFQTDQAAVEYATPISESIKNPIGFVNAKYH